MIRVLMCLVVLGAISLAGCGATDFTEKDDAINAQEKARLNRGTPGPTELPPGLGADLPSATPPMTSK